LREGKRRLKDKIVYVFSEGWGAEIDDEEAKNRKRKVSAVELKC
jgi:hypothetical protein